MIKLEITSPNNINSDLLNKLVFEFIPVLSITSENKLAPNNVDHNMHINKSNINTPADLVLSLKNPPGYVEIMKVIIITKMRNKALPYVEKRVKFSNKFVGL